MIKFKTLSIQNFLSYGATPTVIDLDPGGTTLIVGEDLDNTAAGTGANGVGKAQPLHCKIKTPFGWTTMGDISIGDIVSTPDGRSAAVTGIFPQGEIETYRVYFADGRTTEACGEHLWSVNSHRWQKNNKSNASKILSTMELKKYVDEANIKNKSWYNITVPTITHPNQSPYSFEVDPYLLGALLGDGTICYRNIRFSTIDDEIAEKVSTSLVEGFAQELVHQKDADWYVRNITTKVGRNPIADTLDELSLLGTHSDTKFIPQTYLTHSNLEQKLDLLRGLLDTDGTVGKNGAVTYCTVSEQLSKDVQYLIRSIGGKAKISTKIPFYTNKFNEKIKGKLAYNILIQYSNPQELFSLKRKIDRIAQEPQYSKAGLCIVKIKKIHKQVSQCIMIDHPEHLYITDDFIVTHNTVWLNALVFALYGKPVSNISMDNLVNNINNTHLEVIVEFQKDDKLYVVKRVRKEKGLGNYAKVFARPVGVPLDMSVNTEQDVTPDSVKHINDYIAEALGIPHELFVRIVAFSATHTPFLDLPVRHATQANQSDIMEELFRLVRLSEKAGLLKAAMKDTKTSLEIKQKHNEQLEKEHERHAELLSTAKERVDEWVERNKDSITFVKADLKTLSKYDIEGQQKLFDDVAKQNDVIVSMGKLLDEIVNKNKGLGIEYEAGDKEVLILEEQLDGLQDKVTAWDNKHADDIKAHEEAKTGLVDTAILDSQEKFHQDLLTVTENRSKLITGRDTILDKIADINTEIKKDEDELKHLDDATCPYCLQKYESAEAKITGCNTHIKENTGVLEAYKESLEDYDKKIDVADKDLNVIASTITLTEDDIIGERQLRIDLFKKIDELKAMENPFNLDEAKVIEARIVALNFDLMGTTKEITDLNFDIISSQRDMEAEEVELIKLVEQIEFNSLEELWEVKGNKTRLEEKLKELKEGKNPHQESYTELLAAKIDPIDMDTINHLDKVLTHQNYLLKLLTKKDSFIRKNLLNKNLVFLNTRLRGYLNDLGLPHRVEFTQEMTAHISQFGRQLDFGNLSSGQKARVNLALSFSFRDVLQRSLDSVNVCMLDEVLDVGLDSVGVQNAAHMMKRKAREDELTLFIISHRDEVSGIFDKTLTVTMEKGFSRISQAA